MLWQPEATLAAPWGPTKVSHNDARAATRIVVIGAGIAGCTAARQLQALGFSVKVLEARSRVGGRIHTTQISGYAMAGAAASATRALRQGRAHVSANAARMRVEPGREASRECGRAHRGCARRVGCSSSERAPAVCCPHAHFARCMPHAHVTCCIPRARLRARMCVVALRRASPVGCAAGLLTLVLDGSMGSESTPTRSTLSTL